MTQGNFQFSILEFKLNKVDIFEKFNFIVEEIIYKDMIVYLSFLSLNVTFIVHLYSFFKYM